MKNLRAKNRFMMFVFFLVVVLGFGALVMALWNAILPSVLGIKTITFLQALGILLLSKVLFGGFGGRGGWRYRGGWQNMKEKWAMMSPEEQEKFKSEWDTRCSGWKRRGNFQILIIMKDRRRKKIKAIDHLIK